MKNGPFLWDQILSHFPPSAIIAGGAIRDWWLGVEPKDFDVFIPCDVVVIPPEGFEELGSGSEYDGISTIDTVYRGTLCGVTVDIILHADPEIINNFDFGITRGWYSIRDGLIDTVEAKTDRENGTVTLLGDLREPRTSDRFKRFNDRMGGHYQLVLP